MSMDKTIARMRQEAEELQIALRVFDRLSGNGHQQARMGAIERAMTMHQAANGKHLNGGNGLTPNGKKMGRPPKVREEHQPRLIPDGREEKRPVKMSRARDKDRAEYIPSPGKELPQVDPIPDLDLRGMTAYEGMKLVLQKLKKPVGAREMSARLAAQGQPLKDPRGVAVLLSGMVHRDKAFKRLKGNKNGKGATFVFRGA